MVVILRDKYTGREGDLQVSRVTSSAPALYHSLFVYGLKCVLLSDIMSLYLSCHLQNSYLNQSARVVIVIKRHVVKQHLNVSN